MKEAKLLKNLIKNKKWLIEQSRENPHFKKWIEDICMRLINQHELDQHDQHKLNQLRHELRPEHDQQESK